MIKKTLLLSALLIFTGATLFSQTENAAPTDAVKKDTFWKIGGDFGLDFNQILFINPRVGSGDNRIGFGGLMNLFANYKKGKLFWDNSFKFQMALQRLGEFTDENPFEKTLDNLRLGSKVGLRAFSDKTFWALDATFESQLTKTYEGNFLKPQADGDALISEFLSPATITVSPGIEYKPNEHLSFFLSPASFKTIIVANDSIAQSGVHGNEPIDRDDLSKGYKNSFNQFGASFKALYKNKFIKDKFLFSSEFNLYSNYLFEPQNIDVFWNVDMGFVIWKGVSINVVTNLYYDHDIFIPVDKNDDGIFGDREGGPRTTFTEALVIKYNYVFK